MKTRAGRHVRVLLADNHSLVLESWAAELIPSNFLPTGVSGDGPGAIDLRMPELDVLTCIRRLLAELPQARLMITSKFLNIQEVLEALKDGATAPPPGKETRGLFVRRKGLPRKRGDLTEREAEVLRLLAAGQTNKAISQALHITEGTVKLHLYRVYQKLGVNSRTEAMRIALRKLDTPDPR